MRSGRLALLAAAAALTSLIGCDSARPVEQRSEASACARCHGFPPPAPHPQDVGSCQVCHSTTVGADNALLADGTHMNGRVDATAHPVPYGIHPVTALQGLGACRVCHGADFGATIVRGATPGGPLRSCNSCHGELGFADWQTNCTFCHGVRTTGWTAAQLSRAAPPAALPQLVDGHVVHEFSTAYRGVGAHQAHVAASRFANPIACTECHVLQPDLGHITQAVEMSWGETASKDTVPTWDGATCSNYCHGATLPGTRPDPTWAPPSAVACGACHDANPTTGRHPAVAGTAHAAFACSACHGGNTYTTTTADKALHLNRAIDKSSLTRWNDANRTCAALCHTNPDTPRPW